MVSTRQMATIGNNANTNNNTIENLPSSSSILRPSFVTRQNSCGGSNSNNNNNVNSMNSVGSNGGGSNGGGGDTTINTPSLNPSISVALAKSLTTSGTSSVAKITQGLDHNNVVSSKLAVVPYDATATDHSVNNNIQLLDLPQELLTNILSYVDYKNIAQLRLISRKMNDACMHILNSTFFKLITTTYNRFQAIKGNMPRRESARRKHPLACECDIIETCYMRLSLLQMTFGKHIERGHCCFFPGTILDEVYNILNYIKTTPRLEKPYRLTDELFDLSTMAMEYFRDYIEPTLPGIAYFNKDFFNRPPTSSIRPALVISTELSDNPATLPSPPQSNMVLRKGIRKIKQGMKIYNNQLSVLRNELRSCKRKGTEQTKQISEQQKLLGEQRKQIVELANRLDENDKKNEEMSRKFSTLLQELNKCKTELQYGRSKSPAIINCTSCGQRVTGGILPIEDYQAAINNPINKLEMKNPAAVMNENNNKGRSINNAGFVFPDENTTAKLLSMNTATKRLKRCNSDNAFEAELTQIWDENQPSTSSAVYGQQMTHKSVIVSTQSLKSNNNTNNSNNTATVQIAEENNNNNSTSPETSKKARRVQKATRSVVNASGTKRKNYIN